MSKRSDEQLIEEALTHLGILREHLSRGDLADQIVADAVSMRLAAAIDALHHGEPSANRAEGTRAGVSQRTLAGPICGVQPGF